MKKKDRIITIVIADDHPLFRSGVRLELERRKRFKILAETGDGEDAFRSIQMQRPDVAVVDFQMPKLNGLELTRKIAGAECLTKVILLTMHRDKKIFYAALEAGVYGYVLKDDAIVEIVNAVERVAAGNHVVSRELTGLLIEKTRANSVEVSIAALLDSLTATEQNVLACVADLKSNEEISDILFISKRTVENYKVNIADKLGLDSSKRLLRFALLNKEILVMRTAKIQNYIISTESTK